jgi:hypothetical protein
MEGKTKYLGRFETKEAAAAAFNDAVIERQLAKEKRLEIK